jgi:hypothetical protein
MVAAGYAVELIFGLTGLTPNRASAQMPEMGITWNYTTWLNIVFLILAALLSLRFFRAGGRQMLAMMGGAPTSDGATDPPASNGDHHHH